MKAHHTRISDDWITPAYVFDALGETFDLDVAAESGNPRHVPCASFLTPDLDGLSHAWWGFVWMNPPFGHQSTKRAWLQRFLDHGNGIALLPDRTSAPWWQEMSARASVLLFVSPKIKFERPDGTVGESPGDGTTLIACGARASSALLRSGLGVCVVPVR